MRNAFCFLILAVLATSAGCGGGGEASAPTGAGTTAATTGASSGSSSDEVPSGTSTSPAGTDTWVTSGANQNAYVFESETFRFEYPLTWSVARHPDHAALETALVGVGPGNTTDGVEVVVLKAPGFRTRQEAAQNLAARLAEVTEGEHARVIEEPEAFWRTPELSVFFITYRARMESGEPFIRRVALVYFGGRLYRLSCQFAPSRADEMAEPCAHALETLRIEGLGDIPQ
jgi:hypothetical protein